MEGINLISSTYSDDEDDEIEDHHGGTLIPDPDAAAEGDTPNVTDIAIENQNSIIDEISPQFIVHRSRPVTPQLIQQKVNTIVDYGHDELAMSPDHEEEGVVATRVVTIKTHLQITKEEKTLLSEHAQVLSPGTQADAPKQEQLDGSESQAMDIDMNEKESNEIEEPDKDSVDGVTDDDLVAKFLPLPPQSICSDAQQNKIEKFINLKRLGRTSFNAEVRNKKEYRNPDFLRHAVTYQDIDEIGSCFRKEVFDPHGYDKSDFYDEIEADMKREMERKEQERKKNQKVDFVSSGTQSGVITPSPKLNIPIPAAPTSRPGSAVADSTTRDGRNKKSKWDKVDGDQTTTHAALLTAANAGSGYTAFAQQRRRDAEEKKYTSIEKRIERRS